MDFAEALVAEELWGWPVDVLDQLWALHDRAWAGEISLEKWREQDAALRAGLPPVDHEEVGEFRLSWIMEGLRDAPEDIYDRVLRRLAALSRPAPTDEDLWRDLEDARRSLEDPGLNRRGLRDKFRANRDRVVDWLMRPGSGIDAVSGLPWSEIARHRVDHDPDLGPIPAGTAGWTGARCIR